MGTTPFCETCDRWIDDEDSIALLTPIVDHEDIKDRLEQGELACLYDLEMRDGAPASYIELSLLHCPGCRENHFLTVKTVTVTVDSDNDESKDEDEIVENLRITADQHAELMGQW